MKKLSRFLPLLITLGALAAGVWANTPAQRKSRFYMLQGMQQELQENICEAFELYRLAHNIDPENKVAANKYGFYCQLTGDSTSKAKGMSLMREYVEAYPEDFDEDAIYATLCSLQGDYAEAFRVLKRLYMLNPDKTGLLSDLAKNAMYMGQPDTTLYYLNEQERIEGASPFITNAKLVTYFSQGDTVNVLAEADKALSANPGVPYYYLIKGSVMSELYGNDSALPWYQKADSLFPGNWDIKHVLAKYYEEEGDSAAMEQMLYEAMLTEDGRVEDKIDLFAEYVTPIIENKTATEHADQLIQTLLEQYPYEPTVSSLAAQYSAAKGNLADAVDRMTIAVDMASDNIAYHAQLIEYLVQSERYAEAVDAYEAIPENDHSMPYLDIVAVSSYQGLKRYDEALACADSIVNRIMTGDDPFALTPDLIKHKLNNTGIALLAEVEAERGNILFQIKRLDEAVQAYELALSLEPDNILMLNNYAYFSALNGLDLEKAAEMSLKVVTEDADNPVYLDTYAYILFLQGDYDKAAGYMEKALSESTEPGQQISSEYYEHYGDILSKQGHTDRAVEMWRKALDLEPGRTILKDKIRAKKYIDDKDA